MRNKNAFTMVELLAVVLIVGILAAVAVPLMSGRIDSSKWSEGKAAMGTIASALRSNAANSYVATFAEGSGT
jgi:prepilin-type N-terminal cleavage/methylation domain-containing protein